MKMEKRVYITRNTTALHFQAFLLLYLYISDVAPFFVRFDWFGRYPIHALL